jgi:glycosyltransferase involved in cell wall biosynthesis
MRISIIANGFQEHYIINLINALANTDIEIDFIGSDIYPENKLDKRINFINLRGAHNENVSVIKKSYRLIQYYFRLTGYLFQTNSRVVHVQWYRFFLLEGIIMSLLARILGKKAIYTAHDVLPHNRDNRFNRIIFWFIYRFQSEIIVHTGFIRERLIKEFGINRKKIHIVKHGVYEVNEHKEVNRAIARAHFGYEQTDFVILFFGIITKYKGLTLLLEALEALLDQNQVKLLVAGNLATDFAEEMKKLKARYTSGNIKMLLRFIRDEEVAYLFNAADATALPYTEASQSGVLFMSYAYGKPVIAPRMGGFPYDVLEGETGYLFETGKVHSLREAIEKMLHEWKNKPESANQNIRDFASSNYSWQQSAIELSEIYFSSEKRSHP